MNLSKWSLIFLPILLLVASPALPRDELILKTKIYCSVEKVFDGDTIYVSCDIWPTITTKVSVRVRDLDTPETRLYKCDAEKQLAQKAKKYTIDTIEVGEEIGLSAIGYDKYGRLLADVDVPGIGDWAAHMKILGYGISYDGGTKKSWCE